MLRLATNVDIDFLYKLYMHKNSNPFLLYEVMDRDSFEIIAISLLEKKVKYIYEQDVIRVGMCKLVPQPFRNSHCLYIGGVAIHPIYVGKGLAKQMFTEIIHFAKSNKFTRLELTVATTNSNAIKLYESVGFVAEGILKNYTYLAAEKKYVDEQMMALLF